MDQERNYVHANFAEAVRRIHPEVDFTQHVIVEDQSDGKGPYLAEWNLPGEPPTDDEITAAMAKAPTYPIYVPTLTLLGRLSPAEYTAIRQAAMAQLHAGDGQLEMWLDMARVAPGGVNINDAATVQARAALVSSGLLTQARADIVFAP